MNLRDLKLRLRTVLAPRRVERELHDELAFHIERETQKGIAHGLSPAEARVRALARFGSVTLTADECRDARGTGFLDNCARDIVYAFRTFRRSPLAALTIVTTVALGLGLLAAVFTMFNAFFFNVDAVRNPDELFEVHRRPRAGARVWMPFTPPQYEALRSETNVFSDAVAMLRIGTRIDGRPRICALVSGNFFQVLGVRAALGRTLTPADDERFAGTPAIVLSHQAWTGWFGQDPSVIGRTARINGFPYEVVGIAPEGFRGLSIGAADYWAPLSLAGQFRHAYAGREDEIGITVIGRLKQGVSPDVAATHLTSWARDRIADGETSRASTVTLTPRRGTLREDADEALLVFSPLFFAFGLILIIGCANVANLLLARGVSRQREIGIRLSLGASRARIVRQLLTESLLLALSAAVCALAVSRFALRAMVFLVTSTMPAEIAEALNVMIPAADWRVLAFLLAGALVSTVSFGLAAALQATRLELVRTMRGEVTRDARPSRARHALVAVQVGASALLLICATVFLRTALSVATLDPGIRTTDTVMVDINNEPLRAGLIEAVRTHQSVAEMAASWPSALALLKPATADASTSANATASATPAGKVLVGYQFVSPDFFNVLGIRVLSGRSFTPAERNAEAGVVLVGDATARQLWPNREALGQVVRLQTDLQPKNDTSSADSSAPSRGTMKKRLVEPQLPAGRYTVIGVVREVRSNVPMFDFATAGVYLPIGPESPATSLTLRVWGDPEQARLALYDRLTKIDPAFEGITTMRMMAGLAIYILRSAFWVAAVLGGLALVLTLSGLFSVLSYLVEQRTREIGVRMALGATPRNIERLVLSQLLAPIGVGLSAGVSFAAALAIVLRATPAAAQIANTVRVLDPVAYTASVVLILAAGMLAASIPALRAARVDPIAALRQD